MAWVGYSSTEMSTFGEENIFHSPGSTPGCPAPEEGNIPPQDILIPAGFPITLGSNSLKHRKNALPPRLYPKSRKQKLCILLFLNPSPPLLEPLWKGLCGLSGAFSSPPQHAQPGSKAEELLWTASPLDSCLFGALWCSALWNKIFPWPPRDCCEDKSQLLYFQESNHCSYMVGSVCTDILSNWEMHGKRRTGREGKRQPPLPDILNLPHRKSRISPRQTFLTRKRSVSQGNVHEDIPSFLVCTAGRAVV